MPFKESATGASGETPRTPPAQRLDASVVATF